MLSSVFIASIVSLVLLIKSVDGFNGFSRGLSIRTTNTAIGVKDLFSDDLFEDEEDDKKAVPAGKPAFKKSYLDEKWQLEKEDQDEFKGFAKEKKEGDIVPVETEQAKVPVFALMYKFRQEYYSDSVESVMADHKGYGKKFKRLVNSQLMKLSGKKGVVLLWAGFEDSEEDSKTTKADIMTFLEDDPLINKDMVESWDIIDLKAPKRPEGAPVPKLAQRK